MKRYSPENDTTIHELIIVGGGIYGASMAYTSALNGISPVVLEQDDFCRHTSANSQKVIHGGLRYLQTLDIKRVVESIREKQRFYHLFPHQVKPLPCLLPTTGYTMKGNEAFRLAFLMYGMIEKLVCRNKLTKNLSKRPAILSRQDVARRFSHMEEENIRGGALWYDGICLEPERVIIGLLQSAAKLGGKIANQMKVVKIERRTKDHLAVFVEDKLEKKTFCLLTKKIALCSGSWFQDDLELQPLPVELQKLSLIRGMNIIVPSLFNSATSFATKVRNAKGDGSRFLFIVPWKNHSIEGTHWEDCPDPSKPWETKDSTVAEFHLTTQKALSGEHNQVPIESTHVGYVPGTTDGKPMASDRILGHYKLVDREENSPGDVIQVVGVKFTTAFDVVFKALQHLFPSRKIKDVLSFSNLPCGSPAEDPGQLFGLYRTRYQSILNHKQCKITFQLFGNALPYVIQFYLIPLIQNGQPISDHELYTGLTRYCVNHEMTLHLDDLIYRRLFPDSPCPPDPELLNVISDEMARLLLWTPEQLEQETLRLSRQ
jgi:glycerol-3-phosphate dehydrogenase